MISVPAKVLGTGDLCRLLKHVKKQPCCVKCWSLRDVQELAGHRALTTTERYIAGNRDAQRKLVSLI